MFSLMSFYYNVNILIITLNIVFKTKDQEVTASPAPYIPSLPLPSGVPVKF